ncbi:hypothetical protein SuNHUV7_10680 (plasmid) [Pseudoseohaeicola sp. NH-UV-7]
MLGAGELPEHIRRNSTRGFQRRMGSFIAIKNDGIATAIGTNLSRAEEIKQVHKDYAAVLRQFALCLLQRGKTVQRGLS